MVMRRVSLGLAWCAALLSCEIEKTVVQPAEPVIVVHGVLNTTQATQYVVVESSHTGGNQVAIYVGLLPGVVAAAPLSGAAVELEHLDPPPGCAGTRATLDELPLTSIGPDTIRESGVYATDAFCAVRPGDRVALTVRALGREVRGTTVVPEIGGLSVSLEPGSADGADTLVLRRDRDSLWVAAPAMAGAALQYEIFRSDQRSLFDPGLFTGFPYTFVTDTNAAVVSGAVLRPFDGEQGRDVFEPGHYYALIVAATDRNYFDFARSGSDLFTGRGFINHLEGGIGVFGSVDPRERIVKVVAERRTPEEGIYRITGDLAAGPVDIRLDVYRGRVYDDGFEPFGAFVDGTWAGSPVHTSAVAGDFGQPYASHEFSVFLVVGAFPDAQQYFLGGTPGAPGEPFPISVSSGTEPPETLTAVQETSGGP